MIQRQNQKSVSYSRSGDYSNQQQSERSLSTPGEGVKRLRELASNGTLIFENEKRVLVNAYNIDHRHDEAEEIRCLAPKLGISLTEEVGFSSKLRYIYAEKTVSK